MREDLTATEQCILTVLADGLRHSRDDLRACLWDELAATSSVKAHICNLRRKLRPAGRDVVCEYRYGTFGYRLVRLLGTD